MHVAPDRQRIREAGIVGCAAAVGNAPTTTRREAPGNRARRFVSIGHDHPVESLPPERAILGEVLKGSGQAYAACVPYASRDPETVNVGIPIDDP